MTMTMLAGNVMDLAYSSGGDWVDEAANGYRDVKLIGSMAAAAVCIVVAVGNMGKARFVGAAGTLLFGLFAAHVIHNYDKYEHKTSETTDRWDRPAQNRDPLSLGPRPSGTDGWAKHRVVVQLRTPAELGDVSRPVRHGSATTVRQ